MANQKISRYPGIRSFETDERELFFGRQKETQELFNLIKVQRSVVLFAKSGIGKTSLLNAGVIPLLTEDIYYPIKVRFQHTGLTPAQMLRAAVETLAESVWLKKYGEERLARMVKGREPLLWEYLKAYSFEQKLHITPILIFDQFEEFFMHSAEHQQAFAECLADIIYFRTPKQLLAEQAASVSAATAAHDDLFDFELPEAEGEDALSEEEQAWRKPLDWKVIISLRSDRLSLLDNLSKTIPAILDNRYQLYSLGKEQALEAIVQPSQLEEDYFLTPTFDYALPTLDIIQNNLSNERGEIESFQLQIICQHIEHQLIQNYNNSNTTTSKVLVTPDYLGSANGIQDILNGYYVQRIQLIDAPADRMKARKLIEESLIVEGARVSLAETILINRYKIAPALLAHLQNTRLIRVENTHLGRAYEVSHDTLVAPILKSYEERRQQELREKEEADRVAELARAQKQREESEKKEALMRKKIAEQRRIIVGFVLLGGLMLVAALLAVWQWQLAQRTSGELVDKNQELTSKQQELELKKSELERAAQELQIQLDLQQKLTKTLADSEEEQKKLNQTLSGTNKTLQTQKTELIKKDNEKQKLNDELKKAQKFRAVNDGDVYFKAKEYNFALQWYQYALSLAPDDAIVKEKVRLTQEAMKR